MEFKSDMGVELINYMGNDAEIAEDARTSTKFERASNPEKVGLIRRLITDGHWSPFEHAVLKFGLDVPLFVRDQVIRHKSLSFSVFSLRYSEAHPVFWVPAEDRPLVQVGKAMDYRRQMGDSDQARAVDYHLKEGARQDWNSYRTMINYDITPEVARTVLPTSLYTRMVVTGNVRSWMHFLAARMDEHAQWEIHEAAAKMAVAFADRFPVTYRAFAEQYMQTGSQIFELKEVKS